MLQVFEKVSDIQAYISECRKNNLFIGFVPTMGALHSGHASLVTLAKKQNDVVIVSIFVNPTQFNDKKDLDKYPRTLDADVHLLAPFGVDVIFAPTSTEVYPKGDTYDNVIDLGGLDTYMDGAFRPGHFTGVAQVVKRLLDIVTPDRLYMGQKDFQQFTIISYMIRTLKIPTELVVCKIIREPNGLAMSSRNERLSRDTRDKAGIIFKTLQAVKKYRNKKTVEALEGYAMRRLSAPPFEPEYVKIVDGYTLTPLTDISSSTYAVVCVAVWADGVRLIDNIIL